MNEQATEAIEAVVAKYPAAWTRHDMDAWGELFADDVDYVNRAGGIWTGNAANVAGHKEIHEVLRAQRQKMTWSAKVEKVSVLAPDVALAHVTWTWPGFRLPSGEQAKDYRGVITMVMVRRGGKWLIRALHNTVAGS